MRVHRSLAASLAVSMALVAGASCGGSDKKSTGPNGLEKSQLTVGVIPIPDSAPVAIASAQGFFKAEGLTVKLETIQGGAPAMQKLLGGGLDVTLTNYVSLFLARSRGNKLEIVANAAQARPHLYDLMVTKTSALKTPADLKGKRIAVNTLKNVGELSVVSTLKAQGVDPKDVKFVEYPFPNMAQAVQKGDVDAAWMTEPFITAGTAKLGMRSIGDTMTGATANLPIAGWAVSDKFAKADPKTVAAFQRAVGKAQRIAASDPTSVQKIMPTYAPIDAATVKAITLPVYPTTVDPAVIQRVPDLMLQYGYLKEKADAKAAIAGTGG
ncbi:ABC transporter substrate-binding protein [Actinomadura barringtoniae]|uniref:ABC transporter substrate-binding protein n=1 Tax=Actinomadura barringtoniae TaxID=1427535 RepID=A0A939P6E2_9ACTN|nr:ABC transporter substrate-binding protein [Actinomadura barringtoniae]MBO2446210.1 ABC transporter substrate-binding protein [Actinomadura barringtoniae]